MTDRPAQKQGAPTCGHGHGPLMEIPDHGLRCPACFPDVFTAEILRLREIIEADPNHPKGRAIAPERTILVHDLIAHLEAVIAYDHACVDRNPVEWGTRSGRVIAFQNLIDTVKDDPAVTGGLPAATATINALRESGR